MVYGQWEEGGHQEKGGATGFPHLLLERTTFRGTFGTGQKEGGEKGTQPRSAWMKELFLTPEKLTSTQGGKNKG